MVPLVYFIYLLNSYVRRKYTFTCIFLQSVNIFAILHHPCSFWVYPDLFDVLRGEDDGYANQPMCAIFSRSIGRSDVIIVQSHMCVNFPCTRVGRGVRENSTITFKIEVLDR